MSMQTIGSRRRYHEEGARQQQRRRATTATTSISYKVVRALYILVLLFVTAWSPMPTAVVVEAFHPISRPTTTTIINFDHCDKNRTGMRSRNQINVDPNKPLLTFPSSTSSSSSSSSSATSSQLYTVVPSSSAFNDEEGSVITNSKDTATIRRDRRRRLMTIAKITILALSVVLAGAGVVSKRVVLTKQLNYVTKEWLVRTLEQMNGAGYRGVVVYMLVFLVWNMTIGISTPVETAAGMAFGPVTGILASGTSKFLAAFLIFLLARYQYKAQAEHHLFKKYELLHWMQQDALDHPFRVALLCRFAPLPELIKNGGMGVLPIPRKWYVTSLLVHGLSFTCLWTYLGYESVRVLTHHGPPSMTLKYLLTAATWMGGTAPVVIGIWLRRLQTQAVNKTKTATINLKSKDTQTGAPNNHNDKE